MPAQIQNYFLQKAESIWKSLDENMQPESIWIAEYDVVPSGYYGQNLDKLLLNVWFEDKKGVSQRDVLAFKRYVSVHSLFEGIGLPTREQSRILKVGIAQFAKYENQANKYYFDYHFGGFCAAGFEAEFNEFGELKNIGQIWIS
jgi:hypothetical protein